MSPLSDRAVQAITRQWRLDAYGALLIAVVFQAVEDANAKIGREPLSSRAREHWAERKRLRKEARWWLEDRGYVWICEATGVPYTAMDSVLERVLMAA
jgi:hypothetical protein